MTWPTEHNWRTIADKLARALRVLEEDPNDLTTWRDAFKALDKYNDACYDDDLQKRKREDVGYQGRKTGWK